MPYKDPEAHRAYQNAYRAANIEKQREYMRRWVESNPERYREYKRQWHQKRLEEDRAGVRAQTRRAWLGREYGMSEEEYDSMNLRQQGMCGICGDEAQAGKALHVDHDHDTGVVRGLLCGHCNRAIGLLRDDPKIDEKAAAYLRQFIDEENDR